MLPRLTFCTRLFPSRLFCPERRLCNLRKPNQANVSSRVSEAAPGEGQDKVVLRDEGSAFSFDGDTSENQRGYAYLMALFMVVALIITSQIAVRNILTEGRRERESDLIWRGQQYVRAIRLYYRKTGHYPSNLDDLKKGMPELHFLRYAAYKDPMKKDDGAWRFIYVNAAGQIIGSTRYATLQQMAIMDMNGGKIPGVKKEGDDSDQPGVPASSLADQSNNLNTSNPPGTDANANSQNASSQNPSPNSTPPVGATPDNSQNAGVGSNGANPGSAPQAGNPSSPNPNSPGASPSPTNTVGAPAGGPGGINTNLNNQSMAALAALKPTGPVDGPVLGGFLTGVASSVDKPSIRIYNGGKKYLNWEFIWNPVEDQAKAVQQGITNPAGTAAGQPGQAIGTGAAGTSGSSIFGNGPGASSSPNGSGMNPNPMGTSSPGPSPNSAPQ